MSFLKLLSLFIFAILIGFIGAYFLTGFTTNKPKQTVQSAPSPSIAVAFDPVKPPSDSLTARVAAYSGEVKWQSREATEPTEVKSLTNIHQGEKLVTGDSGQVRVEFPGIWQINISANSEIEFAQTLPANLVVVQSSGTVKYQKSGTDIVSIRALHLLVNQDSGTITVSINKDKPTEVIDALQGSATIAYEDSDNVSQEIKLETGKQLTFDDETRKIKIR